MKTYLLEYGQSLSDTPHLITNTKAKRLLNELKVAVQRTPHIIQLTVAKAWSIVKTWLRGSPRETELSGYDAAEAPEALAYQRKKRSSYPSGAEFNFSRWPSPDLRTL
jgi:hypothetical protein